MSDIASWLPTYDALNEMYGGIISGSKDRTFEGSVIIGGGEERGLVEWQDCPRCRRTTGCVRQYLPIDDG
jgi:hypothetical protein